MPDITVYVSPEQYQLLTELTADMNEDISPGNHMKVLEYAGTILGMEAEQRYARLLKRRQEAANEQHKEGGSMKTIRVGGKIINLDNVAYTEEFIFAAPGLLFEEAEPLGLTYPVTRIVFNAVGKNSERLTLELDGDQRTTFLEQWSAQ